jgi:hypothetical protein
MAPEVRDLKTRKKLRNWKTAKNEPVGIGGRPLKSIWINPPPLGSNEIHFIEFPHQIRKFLLNLAPSEPFPLVHELPCFDNPIKLDPLLSSSLDLHFHNLIIGFMLPAVRFISVGFKCSAMSEVSNNGGKYSRRRATLNTECSPRKGGMLSSKELSPTTLVMV